MIQWLAVACVIFLRQVTHKQSTWQKDGSWWHVPEEAVLQVAGTQTLRTYVARKQETVAYWVATHTIFDVCVRETGYEGGGRLWVTWWRQKAAEDQLRVTVENILATARVQWQQESGRRDRIEVGEEGRITDSKD